MPNGSSFPGLIFNKFVNKPQYLLLNFVIIIIFSTRNSLWLKSLRNETLQKWLAWMFISLLFLLLLYCIPHVRLTCALNACPRSSQSCFAYCSDLPVSVAYRTVAFMRFDKARPNSFDVNFTALQRSENECLARLYGQMVNVLKLHDQHPSTFEP